MIEHETAPVASSSSKPRQGVALGVVVALLALGVVGIAVVSRADRDELPLLPIAAGARGEAAAMASDMRMAAPVDYRLGNVSQPGYEAPAYKLSGTIEVERAEMLRDALGLQGAFKSDDLGYELHGGGMVLRVERRGAMPWAFYRAVEESRCGPDTAVSSDGSVRGCAAPMPADVGGSAGGGSDGAASPPSEGREPTQTEPCPMPPCPEGQSCVQMCPKPMPMPEPQRPAGMPTAAAAEQIARELLSKVSGGVEFANVETHDGFSVWQVVAHPTVGGLSTSGFEHGVAVGPNGRIDSANGYLAVPEKVGDYPLVSLQAALDRFKDGQMPMGRPSVGAPEPVIAEDGPAVSGMAPDVDCGSPTVMCDPPPGEFEQPEPQVLVLTQVELILQAVFAYDGGPESHLVPAFRFSTDVGWAFETVAVPDEYTQRPAPVPQPEPAPYPTPEPGIEPDRGPETKPEPQPYRTP